MTAADLTAADELRAAAERLHTLAARICRDCGDRAWHVEECAREDAGDCPCIVAHKVDGGVHYVADAEDEDYAAYIAAMHPDVGLALADWLESELFAVEARFPRPHALAVARAINAGSGS